MGVDINLKTRNGRTCLHIAALYGHLNLCKAFVDKHNFDVKVSDNSGWTALHFSAKNGSCELVSYFHAMGSDIYHKTKYDLNCLHIAALYGQFKLCKTLINKHDFDIKLSNNQGLTVLHCSAMNGSSELITFFLGTGNITNLKTKSGENCLHIAVRRGHLNLFKTLIDTHYFDVHLPNDFGWTVLHYSAKRGSYELFTYLHGMGIDINFKTNFGENCLHIAAEYGHLSLCKTIVDTYNFNVHLSNNNGWTALHFSVKSGSDKLVSYFLAMGVDINLKTKNGQTCLHIAALYRHLNLCKTFIDKHNF